MPNPTARETHTPAPKLRTVRVTTEYAVEPEDYEALIEASPLTASEVHDIDIDESERIDHETWRLGAVVTPVQPGATKVFAL